MRLSHSISPAPAVSAGNGSALFRSFTITCIIYLEVTPVNETKRIADQLRRSQQGTAWHGPAVGELLNGVDAALADRRPLPGAHNIWELVLHITAWQAATLRAVRGDKMPQLDGQADWPVTGRTEQDWRNAVERLDRVSKELVASLENFPDERLSDTVPGRDYSFYFLLHGVVQHNIYHAGQMAILKAGARA
jgi:uncharacterized damage-inducible protein DinB